MSKNAQYNFNQLKDTDIKLIPQEVFLERLMCCSTCGDGIICPYYESFLKSKNKVIIFATKLSHGMKL